MTDQCDAARRRVASERVTCATESCTSSFPTSGILRAPVDDQPPEGVRDQNQKATALIINSGASQTILFEMTEERPTTMTVTVGSLLLALRP